MGRNPCCFKEGMNRGAWTALEDKILTDYIKEHGEGKWRNIPKQAGLKRCGKSCRLRWLNYLRPDIKRGNISKDEEDLIIRLHKLLGNRWSLIAGRLPGRTDNEIKNYWNTNLSKKAQGKESNNSKSEKNPTIRPPANALLLESGLVRAKPSRCTKVQLNPQKDQLTKHNDTNVPSSSAINGPSMDCHLVIKNEAEAEAEAAADQLSESSDGSSILLMGNDQILSDFEIGEISLSEILDPDFDLRDFNSMMEEGDGNHNNIDGCYKSELSPFSDQELLISEEMMEDFVQAAGVDSDFQCLGSWFEPEWLGDDELNNIVHPN